MLVASWNLTLTLVGRMRFDFTTAFSIYGRTQLLKYLPLNIFHLAGRYAMLRARGYEHRAIVGSTGAELGLAATSAVVLATLSDAWSLAQHLYGESAARAVVPISLAIVTAMCIVVWRLSVFGSRGSISLWPTGAIWMLLIGLIYTAYFIGLGTIATVIAASMAGVSSAWTNYPLIVGVVSVAWLVGLVTPGAPAGLGVRERLL